MLKRSFLFPFYLQSKYLCLGNCTRRKIKIKQSTKLFCDVCIYRDDMYTCRWWLSSSSRVTLTVWDWRESLLAADQPHPSLLQMEGCNSFRSFQQLNFAFVLIQSKMWKLSIRIADHNRARPVNGRPTVNSPLRSTRCAVAGCKSPISAEKWALVIGCKRLLRWI